MARLKEIYKKEIAPALTKQFGYKSPMQVPRITKITLNMGVGEATGDKKILDNAVGDMQKVSGRSRWSPRRGRPSPDSRSAKAIRSAAWSRCAGSGCTSSSTASSPIALPRVRDFRGISGRAFDGRGNYNIGIKEQIIFPEIEYDKIDARPRDEHFDHDDREDRRRSPRAAHRVPFPVQELKADHVETGFDQSQREAQEARRQVREEARRAAGDRATTRRRRKKRVTRRASRSRRCPATRTRPGCATAAR